MGKAVALIYPTDGHVSPSLAVIEELVDRGETVEFHGTPRWRERVARVGASFVEYEAADADFNPDPPTEGLFHDMSRLLALSDRLLPNLLARVKEARPDYLLLDTKSVWGRLVGQVLGVPAATMSVVFAISPELVRVPDLVRALYGGAPDEALVRGLQQLERYGQIARRLNTAYGVSAPDIIGFLGNPQPLNLVFTSRELQLEGARFGAPYVFVGASFARERLATLDQPIDLEDDAPLVYMSLGTTFNDAPSFYRACLEACAGLPCRALISTGGRDVSLPAAPANVTVRAFVPQLPVLKRAAAFVTHGGMNSANEGLYFGVPMVVVPQRGDQHLVAARIEELGAGLAVPGREVSPARLRAAVSRLLSEPDFRERARALGRSVQSAGGPARAADEILAWRRRDAEQTAPHLVRGPARASTHA